MIVKIANNMKNSYPKLKILEMIKVTKRIERNDKITSIYQFMFFSQSFDAKINIIFYGMILSYD